MNEVIEEIRLNLINIKPVEQVNIKSNNMKSFRNSTSKIKTERENYSIETKYVAFRLNSKEIKLLSHYNLEILKGK